MQTRIFFQHPSMDAREREVAEDLLNEIADQIDRKMAKFSRQAIVVRNWNELPQTCFQRTTAGEIIVMLCVPTGWHHCQRIYQFAHEYCHVRTNFREEGSDKNPKYKWVDEVFAQMTALWCLQELAARWVNGGPVPGAAEYASHITEYLNRRLSEVAIHPQSSEQFYAWVSSQQEALAADRYLRASNQAIAAWLLPLFSEQSELWAPLSKWNTWPILPVGSDVYDCFDAWFGVLEGAELEAAKRIRIAIFGHVGRPQAT